MEKEPPKCIHTSRKKKYNIFSTDGVTLVWGLLEDAIHHTKLTIPPALREEIENVHTNLNYQAQKQLFWVAEIVYKYLISQFAWCFHWCIHWQLN